MCRRLSEEDWRRAVIVIKQCDSLCSALSLLKELTELCTLLQTRAAAYSPITADATSVLFLEAMSVKYRIYTCNLRLVGNSRFTHVLL